ncbi:Mannose-P-dolichol utilization defect 1 protein, partial [Homalodisca vitripennis]
MRHICGVYSAWGDSLFLLIQTLVIAVLVLHYNYSTNLASAFLAVFSVTLYTLLSGLTPIDFLWTLQAASVPIMFAGKAASVPIMFAGKVSNSQLGCVLCDTVHSSQWAHSYRLPVDIAGRQCAHHVRRKDFLWTLQAASVPIMFAGKAASVPIMFAGKVSNSQLGCVLCDTVHSSQWAHSYRLPVDIAGRQCAHHVRRKDFLWTLQAASVPIMFAGKVSNSQLGCVLCDTVHSSQWAHSYRLPVDIAGRQCAHHVRRKG